MFWLLAIFIIKLPRIVFYLSFYMFLLRSFIYLLCLAGVAFLIQLEGFDLQQNALYSEETLTEHMQDILTFDKDKLKLFNSLILDKGIFKGDSKYYVSIAHTEEDVQQTVEAFIYAIERLKDS